MQIKWVSSKFNAGQTSLEAMKMESIFIKILHISKDTSYF